MRARHALLVLAACGSPSATLTLTSGGESDALTQSPAVDTLLVEEVTSQGQTKLSQVTLPTTTDIDLGSPSQADIASIQLTGTANGTKVVTGATPFAELGAFSGETIPVFIQRTTGCDRMPDMFVDGRTSPLLATTGRSVYAAGGTVSGAQGPIAAYDMLFLSGTSSDTLPPPLNATSFAVVQLTQQTSDGDYALAFLLNSTDAKEVGLTTYTLYDVSTGDAGATMLNWADVSGGVTVMGLDGTAYIVGASRSAANGPPSQTVLALPPSAIGGSGTGAVARQGAAVALTTNGSLFIYGGNAAGDSAKDGAEVMPSGLTASTTLAYDADPRQGLSAIALSDTEMLIAGDTTTPEVVPLSCSSSSCQPAPWITMGQGQHTLPTTLSSSALFSVGTTAAPVFILVGSEPGGNTRVFRMDPMSVTELPLKIARQNAGAIQFDTGQVIIVGGGSATLESCVP